MSDYPTQPMSPENFASYGHFSIAVEVAIFAPFPAIVIFFDCAIK
jgi:hypothetical protein